MNLQKVRFIYMLYLQNVRFIIMPNLQKSPLVSGIIYESVNLLKNVSGMVNRILLISTNKTT